MRILQIESPADWLDAATSRVDELLLDHAHCERKAAATAVALLQRYPDDAELIRTMSRLAREELRHFEQVLAIMDRRHIAFRTLPPSSYARELFGCVRTPFRQRKLDTLLVGAFIEARSAERFRCLVGRLDDELNDFYARLLESEARHFEVYLGLARQTNEEELESRIRELSEIEAKLICSPDTAFRFHSGPPTARQKGANGVGSPVQTHSN